MSGYYDDESRKKWYRPHGEAPGTEQLQLGCMQRIAGSLEKMEKPFTSLLFRVEMLEKDVERQRARAQHLERSNAALRGALTRAKRKAAGNG